MKTNRLLPRALLGVALVCGLASAKLLLDPAGTSWTFPGLVSVAKASAKGIGKLGIGGDVLANLDLAGDGTFTAFLDATAVSGTWVRKSEKSRKLFLELDEVSQVVVAERYEADFELFAPIAIDTSLELARQKIVAFLELDKKESQVRVKITMRLVFEGLTDGNGKTDRFTRVKARLKGESDPISLGDIVVLD